MLEASFGRFGIDAAVDFDVVARVMRFAPGARALDFLHLIGAKLLTTEPRVHRHDQDQINRGQIWFE